MALLWLHLVFVKDPVVANEAQMRAAFQREEKKEEEGKNRKFSECGLGGRVNYSLALCM